eukprot:5312094-Pyramimonas_sp.AAC.1
MTRLPLAVRQPAPRTHHACGAPGTRQDPHRCQAYPPWRTAACHSLSPCGATNQHSATCATSPWPAHNDTATSRHKAARLAKSADCNTDSGNSASIHVFPPASFDAPQSSAITRDVSAVVVASPKSDGTSTAGNVRPNFVSSRSKLGAVGTSARTPFDLNET